MSREQSTGQSTAAVFSDALADLKRRGSMLLLAGVAHQTLDDACERLLGAPSGEDRRKVIVTTNSSPDSELDPARDRIIHYQTDARSTAAVDIGSMDGPGLGTAPSLRHAPEPEVVDGELSDLIARIDDAIESIETAEGGLDPAELRLCLESADTFIAAHSRESTFEFFHALSGILRRRRAMGHVHLPATFEDESVQLVSPLFDAVIEVRNGGRQRWHLREPELTTEWLQF